MDTLLQTKLGLDTKLQNLKSELSKIQEREQTLDKEKTQLQEQQSLIGMNITTVNRDLDYLSAQIKTEQTKIDLMEKQRKQETFIIEKHKYVKTCWSWLQRHEAKKLKKDMFYQCIYTGQFEIQHPLYTWDQIIAKAHESHFNGLLKNYLKKHDRDHEFIPFEDLVKILKDRITLIPEPYCGCYNRPYDYPDKCWKSHGDEVELRLRGHNYNLSDLKNYQNTIQFDLNDYPKTFESKFLRYT